MTGPERVAVVTALEAFEVGDLELGVTILVDLLGPCDYHVRARCPGCGEGFEWPGLRDRHEISCHLAAELEAAA